MEPHEVWLFKADHDLQAAHRLFETGTPIPDISVFHCQQCAEKSLKAYLAFKSQPVPKTHDLAVLNDLCKKITRDFTALQGKLLFLNIFANKFRYPGDEIEPSDSEVIQALEYADEVFRFIKNILGK